MPGPRLGPFFAGVVTHDERIRRADSNDHVSPRLMAPDFLKTTTLAPTAHHPTRLCVCVSLSAGPIVDEGTTSETLTDDDYAYSTFEEISTPPEDTPSPVRE